MKNVNIVTITRKAVSALVFTSSVLLATSQGALAGEGSSATSMEENSVSLPAFVIVDDNAAPGKTVDESAVQQVNINLASFEQLIALPGIGKVKANAIIAYRQEVGAFKTKEDIQNIKGIGAKLFAKLQDRIAI